jgi:ferrochelatase
MDFDAVLLLSFGGPEGPEQVRPFLEQVTRGRNVPPERLDDVARHYLHFDGVSPINGINRALIDQLGIELESRGTPLPIYFGNRNWAPYVADTVEQMRADGVRSAAVFTTSAWGGYSSCTQYVEDIAGARAAVGSGAPELVKLRQYFDHPLFVEIFADGIRAAAATLPADLRAEATLVFTAHSIPVAVDERHGPRLYSRQVAYATRLAAAAAGYDRYDQVWQSRSGPSQIPWLEPDVGDHLSTLRGGVGPRQRTAGAGRCRRYRAGANCYPQCGTAIRATGRRPHRRIAQRNGRSEGGWSRSRARVRI